jgi:hypothetical protein
MSQQSSTTSTLLDKDRPMKWACRLLQVPVDAPAAVQRALLLQGLEDEEFVPAENQREAVELLVWLADVVSPVRESAEDAWPEFVRAREFELEAEVSALAREYLTLPVADRLPRRLELDDLCEPFPRLLERLSGLAPGDDVERPNLRDQPEAVVALASFCFDAFGLCPQSVSRLRQENVEQWSGEESTRDAATELVERFPGSKVIVRDVVEDIVHWSWDEHRQRRRTLVDGSQVNSEIAEDDMTWSKADWTFWYVVWSALALLFILAACQIFFGSRKP